MKLNRSDWMEINYKYKIQKNGKILSFRYGKPLNPNVTKCGYEIVCLYFNGKKKWFSVHRLIALVHIENGNPIKFNVVNHKDGNKRNNKVSNLEWTTASRNKKHSFEIGTSKATKSENANFAVLTVNKVKQIKHLLENNESCASIGRKFGVTTSNICRIKKGKTWRNV